jgi:hypothetical protein
MVCYRGDESESKRKGIQMTVWMVRAVRCQEQEAHKRNIVTIHWQEFDDELSAIQDREALKKLYSEKIPQENTNQVAAGASQVWKFCKEIERGDLAVLPLHDPQHPKAPPEKFAIGEVTGPYRYRTDMAEEVEIMHTRDVRWLGTLQATDFPQDLLASFGVEMTVYRIAGKDAERRAAAERQIRKILKSLRPSKTQSWPRSTQHPWDEWMSLRANQKMKRLALVQGVDFRGRLDTMAVQIRTQGAKRNLAISILHGNSEDAEGVPNTLFITITRQA